jgi:hypothetical protein
MRVFPSVNLGVRSVESNLMSDFSTISLSWLEDDSFKALENELSLDFQTNNSTSNQGVCYGARMLDLTKLSKHSSSGLL